MGVAASDFPAFAGFLSPRPWESGYPASVNQENQHFALPSLALVGSSNYAISTAAKSMAESTLRHHSVEGYPLKGERATVLCYRLICGILASPRLAQLAATSLDDPISQLRDEYELSEAAHHLVTV